MIKISLLSLINYHISLIFLSSRIEIRFGLFNFEELSRVGRDDLVFAVRCDDFDGGVLGSGKENPLSDIALKQEEFLMIREIECFRDEVDR